MLVVPRTPTPVPLASLPGLIEGAFRALGVNITPTQRANLTVLSAIETGRGRSLQNFNLGNISASETFPGTAWRPPWFEPEDPSDPRMVALHEQMLQGKAPRAFRAYDSLEAGARDYARVLMSSFASVIEAAKQTDPDNFRRALSERYSHDYRNPAVTETIRKLQRELGVVAVAGGSGVAALVLVFVLGFVAKRYLKR